MSLKCEHFFPYITCREMLDCGSDGNENTDHHDTSSPMHSSEYHLCDRMAFDGVDGVDECKHQFIVCNCPCLLLLLE